MPSQEHEAILELFRNRPVLAAEMLCEVFGAELPRFTRVRIEPADLTEVVPRELRADLLVLLLNDVPVLCIIVEAQLQWDPDKDFTLPAYLSGARMRYRCPTCLLIVTPSATLAKRLARPIVLGPGNESIVTPFVLGPAAIPVITDIPLAKERPELAVLSAMAHGDTDVALQVAVAALAASVGLDSDKQAVYADFVLASLNAAARAVLEAQMTIPNYQYRSDFAKRYYKQGKDEGRLEGRLEPVLHLYERRLCRPLTQQERATLVEQLEVQGAEKLTDVALDLSAKDVAKWLADHAKP